MHDRLARIEALVHEALAAPPDQRAAALDRACAAEPDPSLRAEVESLLAYEREASDFLSRPAIDRPLNGGPAAPHADRPPAEAFDRVDHDLDRTVGGYRLIERIGSGGMGHVYRAERTHGWRDGLFDQSVAVKLIRAENGLDHDEVIYRFRLERQILANLNHPNIARLIDGGSTSDGRPYIVMEQVRGQRIDEYCDGRRLTIARRLQLFRIVCDAVQYAHRNLVVHRDLKPSNILVADDPACAGEPIVKLLDFGIAKVLQADSEQAGEGIFGAERTRTVANRLTPAYASPEQVRAAAITTASDVYSLGVILYELLSGRKPYDFGTGSAEEMQRAICHTPPTKLWIGPQERAPAGMSDPRSGGDLAAICAARSTDPHRLRRALGGDLEKIVLMALRKEPERRYATVAALAEDLRRHLAGLPVSAQSDSWRYRAGKFVARHRLAVTGGAAVAAGLALATIVSLVALLHARTAQQRAESSQHSASVVSSYLRQMLSSIDPAVAQGRDASLLHDMLDQTSARLQAAADGEDGAAPPAAREAAELHEAVASAYQAIGEYHKADDHLAQALALRGGFDSDPLDAAAAWHARSRALYEMSRRGEAEIAIREALAIRRAHLPPDDPLIGSTLAMQGNIVFSNGEYERGEGLLRASIDVLRRAAAARREPSPELARALHWLGDLLNDQRQPHEAEPLLLEAKHILVAVHGEAHPTIAGIERSLGWCCRRIGGQQRLEQAAAHFERALAIDRQFLAPDHPTMGYRLNGYASALEDLGRFDEALPAYIEAERIIRGTIGENTVEYGTVCNNLGNLYGKTGRYDEAIPLLERAAETYARTRVGGADDLWVTFPLLNLARVHFHRRDHAAELAAAEESLRIRLLHLAEDDELVDLARVFRADGLLSVGPAMFEEAERDLLQAYHRIVARRGPDSDGPKIIREALVRLYEAWERPSEARHWREMAAQS